jgi:serine/threonine-protein kinase HipA
VAEIIISTEIKGEPLDVGYLSVASSPNDEHGLRFHYDIDFVRHGYAIDPALPLDTSPYELRRLPLAVVDAMPDAWGELLLQAAERYDARDNGRDARQLTAAACLVAASDATRQGALRFRTEPEGPFLAGEVTIPSMVRLDGLRKAAEEVETNPDASQQAVQRLLESGASALGGARPKAAVIDDHGGLWLAKFSRLGDRHDVPLWEMVALDIAENAGLVVPERRLLALGDHRALVVRRFDRTEEGRRRGYASLRTLMGPRELGGLRDYSDRGIGGRLRRQSIRAQEDLQRLWRQAALNLLINNTDNHLGNHGLLREAQGWTLAPVFDLDPNPDTRTDFATHYNGAANRSTGLRGLLSMATGLGIDDDRARGILDEVHQAVAEWDTLAHEQGATNDEVSLFADTFTGLDEEVRRVVSPAHSAPVRSEARERSPGVRAQPRSVETAGHPARFHTRTLNQDQQPGGSPHCMPTVMPRE